MRVKNNLKDLNLTDSDFPEGTRLFINNTLSPYYWILLNKYKKIWINDKKDNVCIKNIGKEALHVVFQKYRLNATP